MVYFVATPIGNLGDISYRAVETLRAVDIIFCEDTRHSLKLLNHYEIKKTLKSCHKFNEREASEAIIKEAQEGKEIAIISDAGMPVISDPGSKVCEALRNAQIPYTVVPGANAVLSALIFSGLPADRFAFLGFLPEKEGECVRLLEKYKNLDATLCIHTAPQDIDRVIAVAYSVLGDRSACAVREITKIHEQAIPFSLQTGLTGDKRGEYVLLIEGADGLNRDLLALSEKEHILYYMHRGMDKKSALKQVARDRGVSKSDLYKFSIDIGD